MTIVNLLKNFSHSNNSWITVFFRQQHVFAVLYMLIKKNVKFEIILYSFLLTSTQKVCKNWLIELLSMLGWGGGGGKRSPHSRFCKSIFFSDFLKQYFERYFPKNIVYVFPQ